MNIPKLRFPEFNDEWAKNYVGNVAGIYLGVTYTPNYVKSGKMFISSKDISKGYLDLSDIKYISEDEYNKISTNAKPIKGDVLFARVGSNLGNPTVIETDLPLTIFVSLGYLRVNKNLLDNYFIKYWMESNYFWQQVDSKVAGGAKQNLNTGWLSKFDIKFPKIVEQKKIANTLELLDKKIELQTKRIEALKLFKKGIFRDFNYKNYKIIKLKDILSEVIEKSKINNQYDILSSTSNGLFLQKEYFNKQAASDNNVGYKILRKNQLVISPQNLWMGNINLNDKYDIGIVSPSYKIFEINKKIINIHYFNNWIKSPRALHEYLNASEQGASVVRRNLNIDLFNEITLKIPNIQMQNKIGKQINNINKLIELENSKIIKLHELKKGLMQSMFV